MNKILHKIKLLTLILILFPSVTYSKDALEDTAFGEDIDKITSPQTIEFINNYSKPNNGTPLWNQFDSIYTKTTKNGYWQLDYGQYQRYNTSDNSILFNASNQIYKSDNGTKIIGSLNLGAGDFSGAGYIPKYKTGGMLQLFDNNMWVSPSLEYRYTKYQNSYTNYYGLYFEKYINNYRFLLGPLVTDSSFYKTTYGGKLQGSYYFNNDSINYYFSASDEPEIMGNSAQIWRVISNSIVYKYKLNNGLIGNVGLEYVVNQNIYNRIGAILGFGYEF